MAQKKWLDPFAQVRAQTLRHRAQHGCGAYPFEDGAILGVIAAAVAAKRVLELGCALGYTALWFAHGAKGASIDTIEFDPAHVRLARENFAAFGVANRVSVHQGRFHRGAADAGSRIRSRFLRWVRPDAGLSADVPETRSPARRAYQLEPALPRRRDARLP